MAPIFGSGYFYIRDRMIRVPTIKNSNPCVRGITLRENPYNARGGNMSL